MSSRSLSSSASQHQPKNRFALTLFACLQNALVGGIVFGWASIDRTMLAASHENGGAHLTSDQTTMLFTYASSTAMLAPLILGPTLDAFGPRTCLALSHLLVALGCGGFALSTAIWQFRLSVICIAFGGPGVGLSIIHNANLFPNNQFLAISILTGAITLSFSMLAVLNAIWEHRHVGFRTQFGGYSLLVGVMLLGTLGLSPNEPYEKEEEDDDQSISSTGSRPAEFHHPSAEEEFVAATIHTYAHRHQHPLLLTDQSLTSHLRREVPSDDEDDTGNCERLHHQVLHLGQHESFYESRKAIQSGDEMALQLMSLKDQPFMVQLRSPTFARAVLIFIVTSFSANFTIASLNTELGDRGGQFKDEEQHDLSQQFTWLLSSGMLYALLVGWLMDRVGLEVCTLMTLILGQISILLMVIPSFITGGAYVTMILGFALYALFRQFLFPVFLAIVSARLGFKYFGILSGIGFFLSGIAQCFMADLVHWVHSSEAPGRRWIAFHLFQIILLGVLWIIPIADRRDQQRREANMAKALVDVVSKNPASATTTATTLTPLVQEGTPCNSNGDQDESYGSTTDAN